MIFNQIEKSPPKRIKNQKMSFLRVEAKSLGNLGFFGKEKTCPQTA
jgi:hypothetical protein